MNQQDIDRINDDHTLKATAYRSQTPSEIYGYKMGERVPPFVFNLLRSGLNPLLYRDLEFTHEVGERIVFNPDLAIMPDAYFLLVKTHPEWKTRIADIKVSQELAESSLASWLRMKHHNRAVTKYDNYIEMLEEAIDYIKKDRQ